MSRPNGTYLFDCRRVYAVGTNANNTWRYYLEHTPSEAINSIRAYAVHVESRRGGAFGRIQELNFPYHVQDVIRYSQPFSDMEVHYTDGTTEITTNAAFSEQRKCQQTPKPFWRAVPIFPDSRISDRLTDHWKHRERYGAATTPEVHLEKLQLSVLRGAGYPGLDMWPVPGPDNLARARIAKIYRLSEAGAKPVTWSMIRADHQEYRNCLYGIHMEDLPRVEAWDRRQLTMAVNKYRRETSLEARQWNNQHTR